jgi:hypothetical protein
VAYGFYGDKQYVSLEIPQYVSEGKIFVKVLARGPVTLYQYQKKFAIKKDSLVVLPSPKGETIQTSSGRRWKEDGRYIGLLNFMFSDCKLSADETSYTEGDLTNLVNNYNRCKGVEPAFRNQKPIFKANYAGIAGYVVSEMTTLPPNEISFNPSKTVVGGLGIELSSPRIFDKVFLTVEAMYVNNFYQAYTKSPDGTGFLHKDVTMDFTSIKMPIGFKYNILRDASTPYVRAGFMIGFLMSHEIQTIEEKENQFGVVSTTVKEGAEDVQNSPMGVWFAAGYSKKLTKKLHLFGEVRYDRGEGFIGTAIQKFSEVTNYSFMLGIRF